MKILLISPVAHPYTPDSRYIGIERMVWEYSRELVKEHKVSVIGHAKSIYPEGVTLLPVDAPLLEFCDKGHIPQVYHDSELKAFQSYQYLMREFDVIHDWSHLHLASRFTVKLPTLNIFFHAPSLARYPKAPYNIIALSEWAAREFHRVYHQKALYQYSIGIDTSMYKLSDKPRGDRFLTIGRMSNEKGNWDVLVVCKEAKVPLDIAGGRGFEKTGSEPPTDYEQAIYTNCDGNTWKFLGEVSEEQKIALMQSCKALIYLPPPNHPEVTSHKIQEAMLLGAPIVCPRLGALPEIVTDKVNGYLIERTDGFFSAIDKLDKLDIMKEYPNIVQRFDIRNVVKNYIPLYEEVANGRRW